MIYCDFGDHLDQAFKDHLICGLKVKLFKSAY